MFIIDTNHPPIEYMNCILWDCQEYRFDNPDEDFFVEYIYANNDEELRLLSILDEALQN